MIRPAPASSRARRPARRLAVITIRPGRNGRPPAYRVLWGYRRRNVIRHIRTADGQGPVP